MLTKAEVWNAPWVQPDDVSGRHLVVQASREIRFRHELFGVGLTALAYCERCDDVVFACHDDTYVIVKLAYKRPAHPLPRMERFRTAPEVLASVANHRH